MQVAEQYRDITGMQLSEQLRRELGKPMAAHLSIKGALYRGLTLVHQAEVFIADDECGEQIACLQARGLPSLYSGGCPLYSGDRPLHCCEILRRVALFLSSALMLFKCQSIQRAQRIVI